MRDAAHIVHGRVTFALHKRFDAGKHFEHRERIGKCVRADFDGERARHDKLDSVFPFFDTADGDDRHAFVGRERAHRCEGFPHEAHGDRTNGRSAEARFDFIEHRHAALYVDGDALKRISDAECVRTRADARERDTRKIGRLRRKLYDERHRSRNERNSRP